MRVGLSFDLAQSAVAQPGMGDGRRCAPVRGFGQFRNVAALFLCLRPLRHGFFADDDVGCVPVGLGALGDGI